MLEYQLILIQKEKEVALRYRKTGELHWTEVNTGITDIDAIIENFLGNLGVMRNEEWKERQKKIHKSAPSK